jgi:DNA polymerase
VTACGEWYSPAGRIAIFLARGSIARVLTADERRDRLTEVYRTARGCERCAPLVATRTQVVFGAGNADADLMFIGEAPGRDEDLQGVPFVGRSGKLLTQLLEEIGLRRDDVFIANVLKCRPPDNRNPAPAEIANCREYLEAQLDLIRPKVVCTLGNFSTKLIRDSPEGITRLRGKPEVVTIGPRRVRLLPLLHPAAALYTPSNVELLRQDMALVHELLAMDEPVQPEVAVEEVAEVVEEVAAASAPPVSDELPPAEAPPPAPDDQLGLF